MGGKAAQPYAGFGFVQAASTASGGLLLVGTLGRARMVSSHVSIAGWALSRLLPSGVLDNASRWGSMAMSARVRVSPVR